ARDAVAPEICNVKGAAVRAHGEAAGDAAPGRVAQSDGGMIGELAVRKAEGVNDFRRRTRREKPAAIMRKAEPVKRFLEFRPGDDGAGGEVEHDDFMCAVAAVQHGGELSARMQCEIDRKIADRNLR